MRRILLCAMPAVFGLAVAHALAQQAIATPILTSDENFRDLAGIAARFGGTGFADTTANDGVMRTGVFYRSEVLNVSNADLATLSSLHITRDIDLRTPSEIAMTPDRVPTGAAYTNVNIYGTPSPPPPGSLTTQAAAVAQFETQYRAFVTDPVERAGSRHGADRPGAFLRRSAVPLLGRQGSDRMDIGPAAEHRRRGTGDDRERLPGDQSVRGWGDSGRTGGDPGDAGRRGGRDRRSDVGRAVKLPAGRARSGRRVVRVNERLPDPWDWGSARPTSTCCAPRWSIT